MHTLDSQFQPHRQHSGMPLFMVVSGLAHALLVYFAANYLLTAPGINLYPESKAISITLINREIKPKDSNSTKDTGTRKLMSLGPRFQQFADPSSKPSLPKVTPEQPLTNNQQHTSDSDLSLSDLDQENTERNKDSYQPIQYSDGLAKPASTENLPSIAALSLTQDAQRSQQDIQQYDGITNTASNQQKLLRQVNDELRKHISYPMLARKRGWAGIVTIAFQFTDTGLIHNIQLSKSSGYPILDQSALNAFQQITHIYFGNAPHTDNWEILQLPVEYRLIEG